ncbi:MAG: tetratricopeptide repeat protein [Bacteroidota bacterium]
MLSISKYLSTLGLLLYLLPVFGQAPPNAVLEQLLTGGSAYEKAQRVQQYAQNLPLEERIPLLETARTLLRDRQLWSGEAAINVALGIAHYYAGDLPRALEHYQMALQRYESQEDWAGLGRCYNEMAILVSKQNDRERALDYLDRSAEYCRRGGDSTGLSTSYDNRGIVLSKLQRWEEAETNYLRALDIRQRIGDSVGLGYVYNNLGEVAAVRGDFERAIQWVEASTLIRQSLGDTVGQTINITNMGELYFQRGQYRQAAEHFERSLQQSRRLAYLDLSRWNLEYASKSYAKLGETERALDYLRQSYALQDSLLSAERIAELAKMETQYETEQKERQIAWQQEEMALRQQQYRSRLALALAALLVLALLGALAFLNYRHQQRSQLREKQLRFQRELLQNTLDVQERERKRIAKDLHDGIGQQLTGLKMAWQHLEEGLNPQRPQARRELRDLGQVLDGTAREVRELSHRMMPRALSELGLVAALEDLLATSFRNSGIQVEWQQHRLDRSLPEVVEINVYRILQELLNNILKHAEATEVDLQLLRREDQLVVVVEDNGRGFAPDEVDPHSQGMLNINSRVRALDGRVDFSSEPGRGTVVNLRIPLRAAAPPNGQESGPL